VHVVVVDPDPRTVSAVQQALGTRWPSCEVLGVTPRARVAQMVTERPPAALLLELDLPGADGLALLCALRPLVAGPLLVLSARTDLPTKLAAFAAGADDYLPEPWGPAELAARLLALWRRTPPPSPEVSAAAELPAGSVRLRLSTREVWVEGQPLPLSPAEFRLLARLVQQADQPVTAAELRQAVWGSDVVPLGRLRGVVHRLRQKLARAGVDPY